MDDVTPDWSMAGPDLQALIDSLPVGILHWDRRRTPFYVSNRAMRELMGAPADGPFPVRGSGISGMVEADRDRIADALRRGEAFEGVVTTSTPGGTKRQLHLRVQGTADLGWSRATPAESDAHAPIEQSARRERFAPLFEHSLVAMFLLDPGGLVLTANPAAARLLGRDSVSELLSRRFDVGQFLPDERLRAALLAELRTRGFVAGREVPLTRADGSQAWVRLDLAVNPDDGFIEMVATDIDEERAATGALRDSERRYRGIFENAVVGVIQMTRDCEILTANRYAARLFGYESVEAFAERWRGEHASTCDEFRQRMATLDASTRESVSEHELLGGTAIRWVRVLQHLDVEAGTVDAFVVDITAEKEAQAERERLIRELGLRATERRQLVRRLLSAGEEERREVAHEIHDGPVQLLAGSLMFLTSAQQEREQQRIETADDYVERGTTYLRTALVELRRVMAHLRPAVLDDLGLTSAIASAGEAALAPYGMSLRVEELGAPGGLDSATEMVLFRVAQEGTTNAGKHSHGAHVGITLDYRDPERLRLVVSDDGEGFDSESAFASADGHHLGLLGLKERVDLVGGTFGIESSPEHGTTITVDVPRHVDGEVEIEPD
ncbi:MAG: PAS domain-containing protein [Dehalococcoidia bacterium]|nr:PAS domain-containing protein [Dehalococcoidia bacterium]